MASRLLHGNTRSQAKAEADQLPENSSFIKSHRKSNCITWRQIRFHINFIKQTNKNSCPSSDYNFRHWKLEAFLTPVPERQRERDALNQCVSSCRQLSHSPNCQTINAAAAVDLAALLVIFKRSFGQNIPLCSWESKTQSEHVTI